MQVDYCDLIELTESELMNVRENISESKTISMPLSELSVLGAGIASLLPAFRTVTQTTSMNMQGLYRLANQGTRDVLKTAKNGNFWGAFKTESGASKFAQLKEVGTINTTSATTLPIDPATIMMAVALFAVEQQLKGIAETQKQILSFLEIEKQSEIEADVETLSKILTTYKHNWDNELFLQSNHKLVLDIERNSRKNMISYKKSVLEMIETKKLLVAQVKVEELLNELQKKFKYYRLSLYNFAMASMVEIMLSGNFGEAYILENKSEITNMSMEYKDIHAKALNYLEKTTKVSLETNILKGVGLASKKAGELIGKIPMVKEGQVDEFLQNSGEHISGSAQEIRKNVLETFSMLQDSGIGVFEEKMEDMIRIYNHTTEICFDDQKIYLLAG